MQQRFLGKALSNLKTDFDKDKKLRDESYILRMARAADESMPAEDVGKSISELLKSDELDGKPGTKVRVQKLLIELAEKADTKNAETDLANVDFDDLKAALSETALDLLLKDKEFFLSVCLQVLQQHPDLWNQIEENRPGLIEVKVADGD